MNERELDAIRRNHAAEERRINEAACRGVYARTTRLEDVAAASSNKRAEDCSLLELAARMSIAAAEITRGRVEGGK